jgi:hypothetical protein
LCGREKEKQRLHFDNLDWFVVVKSYIYSFDPVYMAQESLPELVMCLTLEAFSTFFW